MTREPSPITTHAPASDAERRREGRRLEDRLTQHDPLRTAIATAIAICGGLAVLFLFFALIGAINVGDAVLATVVAVVLALVWLAGFVYRARTGAATVQRPDRERRGF